MLKVKGLNFEQGYFKVSTLKYHVLKYLQIMVNVNVVNEIIYESTRKIKINKNVHYKSTRKIKINKIKVLKARNH
jgi:cystathionine beta-lyase family protein involved in aluminum resistance